MFSIIIVLLSIVLCFYLGILYTNQAMLLLGYALEILLVLSLIELVYRFFTMKCHIEVPITMTEQGKPVTVGLKIRNKGLLPAGKVEVEIGIRNAFQRKGKTRWVAVNDIPAGEKQHTFQIVLYGAGCHEIEVQQMKVYGLFGLLYIKKKSKDFCSVLILPEIHSANVQITEAVRNFIGEADVYDDFRPGHDSGETFEIREYREKDRLQSIHWKLSAKADTLMVKENSLPKACSIVLMLNYGQVKEKWFHKTKTDVGAYLELAASISYSLMDCKCPHFIAWYSKETEDIRRIRIDDEESFYLFLDCYLREAAPSEKNVREEYRRKYKSEWYLHDVSINEKLEIYKNGEFVIKLNEKNIKDECEKLELLF